MYRSWLLVALLYPSKSGLQGLFASQQIRATIRAMEQEKRPRGRPPKPPEEQQVQRAIRLTPALWEKIDRNGLDWLRALIKRAKEPR
jgi:hypothetical protein